MRVTRANVENLKDYIEQITDVADDLQTACEEWLNGIDDPEVESEDHAENRALIEEHGDTVLGAAKAIVQLFDKWGLYESNRDKSMKSRIAELEAEVEALRGDH